MAERFIYSGGTRTSAEIERKAHQSGGLYDSFIRSDVRVFKVHDGDNLVRILPWTINLQPKKFEEDAKIIEQWGSWWNIDAFLHYGVGPDKGSYLCLDKMLKQHCPVCTARREVDDPDEADQLAPKWRGLAWVIDRDSEKTGPQLWPMPVTVYREINDRSVDKRTKEAIQIDNPEEGFDIGFSKGGTGLKTKYTALEVMRDPTPIHDDPAIVDKWLGYIVDNRLFKVLEYFPPEYIEKVLFGKVSRKEEGEGRGRSSGREGDPAPEQESRRRPLAKEADPPAEERRATRRPDPDESREERFRPRGGDAAPAEASERTARNGRASGHDPETGEVDPPSERTASRARPGREAAAPEKESGAGSGAKSALQRLRERRAARE